MAGKNLFSRHGKGDLGLALALLYMDKDPAKQGDAHILNPHNDEKQARQRARWWWGVSWGGEAGEVGVSMRWREGGLSGFSNCCCTGALQEPPHNPASQSRKLEEEELSIKLSLRLLSHQFHHKKAAT